MNMPKQCKKGVPCHVYPTLADQGWSKVVLNVHTHEDIDEVFLFYAEEDYFI